MANTEDTEPTTSIEVIVYKTSDGKWIVAGLVSTIADMKRKGEDVAPLLTALSDEVSFMASNWQGLT